MTTAIDEIENLLASRQRPVHIIAGGGVGMSALGQLLLHLGYRLTASDQNDGLYLQKLAAAGAEVWTGSRPEKIPPQAVVFYSTAVPATDPEREFASRQKLPVFSRHPLLQFLTRRYYTVAVSGTHGKTTTSAWVAYLLQTAGLDPSALVGGTVSHWQSNTIVGRGQREGRPLLVMEADESDGSFLAIDASVAIVTNMEMDHPDHYDSFEPVKENFRQFITATAQRGGFYLPSLENQPDSDELASCVPAQIFDIQKEIRLGDHSLFYREQEFAVGLSGKHNLYNASVILALGLYWQLQPTAIASALSSFRGVARRLEKIAMFSNPKGAEITIMDDYAHHPSEIAAGLGTLRRQYRQIFIVWEPHRISRLVYFFDEFISVLTEAGLQHVWRLPVFTAGDQMANFPGFAALLARLEAAIAPYPANELAGRLAGADDPTVLVFMGAGQSSAICHQLAAALAADRRFQRLS